MSETQDGMVTSAKKPQPGRATPASEKLRTGAKGATDTVLVLAWGNPSRLDDGLGPELARRLEALDLPGVKIETGFQLSVEDSWLVSQHARVLFVDALSEGDEPYMVAVVAPSRKLPFSTHSLKPDGLLGLTEELFQVRPKALLLGIRGYLFSGFGSELSPEAERNLLTSLEFVRSQLLAGGFDGIFSKLECRSEAGDDQK